MLTDSCLTIHCFTIQKWDLAPLNSVGICYFKGAGILPLQYIKWFVKGKMVMFLVPDCLSEGSVIPKDNTNNDYS